jgi:hypothetical protein
VSAKFPGVVKARPFGDNQNEVSYPLRIEPSGHKTTFEIREGFDVMSYLRSPIVLMMLATFGLLGCSQVGNFQKLMRWFLKFWCRWFNLSTQKQRMK